MSRSSVVAAPRKKKGKTQVPAPVAEASSSWVFEPQERGDVFHRVRILPEALKEWRHRAAKRLAEQRKLAIEPAREMVDEGISRMREVLRVLGLVHPGSGAASGGDSRVATRVLGRLGLFREALDLFSPEEVLSAPIVGGELAALLSVHGETNCTEREPACGSCDLRKACSFFRKESVAEGERSGAPTFVDFFAGAGGLSEGFRRAGLRSLGAFDLNDVAMRTYRLNHPETPDASVVAMDITEVKASQVLDLNGGRPPDLILGAPPCQGFSRAGMRSKTNLTGYRATHDARNFLFEHLVRLTLEVRPRLFLMENVPGMETARKHDESFLDAAAGMLEKGGYKTARWRLFAPAFGVPQDRIRTFLVASKGPTTPTQPFEEYQNIRRSDFDPDALPPVGLIEAIFDLPERAAGEGVGVDRWVRTIPPTDLRLRRYLSKFRLLDASPLLWNHFVRYHNENDLELYALLKPGEDSVHAIERYGRGDLMKYRRDVFDDKYARLRPDRPSKTIVSHLAKDGNGYIHPFQTRSISIREAARLQSFSDDFIFCGSPSDQWIQVGNAVPPVLGQAIAKRFLSVLKEG